MSIPDNFTSLKDCFKNLDPIPNLNQVAKSNDPKINHPFAHRNGLTIAGAENGESHSKLETKDSKNSWGSVYGGAIASGADGAVVSAVQSLIPKDQRDDKVATVVQLAQYLNKPIPVGEDLYFDSKVTKQPKSRLDGSYQVRSDIKDSKDRVVGNVLARCNISSKESFQAQLAA